MTPAMTWVVLGLVALQASAGQLQFRHLADIPMEQTPRQIAFSESGEHFGVPSPQMPGTSADGQAPALLAQVAAASRIYFLDESGAGVDANAPIEPIRHLYMVQGATKQEVTTPELGEIVDIDLDSLTKAVQAP